MHVLGGTQDGIHRACLQAQRAAYADTLINKRNRFWFGYTVLGLERLVLDTQQIGQRAYTRITSGRALIDIRLTAGYGSGVGFAARITALAALRLRQYGINTGDQQVSLHLELECGVSKNKPHNQDKAQTN